MIRRRIVSQCLLLAALSVAALTAQAQQTLIQDRMNAEEFKAAGLDKLSPEELAHLNAWLAQKATPVAATAPEPGMEASMPAVGSGTSPAIVGDDKPVHSRLKGSIHTWSPGTVFELENGQQWRVVKGSMKLSKPLESPEIEIAPGLMGRWFLQVDEDAPRARVERIR